MTSPEWRGSFEGVRIGIFLNVKSVDSKDPETDIRRGGKT